MTKRAVCYLFWKTEEQKVLNLALWLGAVLFPYAQLPSPGKTWAMAEESKETCSCACAEPRRRGQGVTGWVPPAQRPMSASVLRDLVCFLGPHMTSNLDCDLIFTPLPLGGMFAARGHRGLVFFSPDIVSCTLVTNIDLVLRPGPNFCRCPFSFISLAVWPAAHVFPHLRLQKRGYEECFPHQHAGLVSFLLLW